MLKRIIIVLIGLLSFSQVYSQINQDTIKNVEKPNPDLIIQNDSTNFSSDSILIREQFVLDSIALRQAFVKDSLYRRKLVMDSLIFLKKELPKLIIAAIKSINEEIIIYTDKVDIIGDSTISDFTYRVLSQKVDQPYSPWRTTIKLSGNSFKIKIDTVNKKIKSVRLPKINYSFNYNVAENIVIMNGRKTIIKNKTGTYYKFPIDSVFFDNKGRVKKIKKYIHYFEVKDKYKKGASLYVDIDQIKEFDYFADGVLSNYRLINYCDRWSVMKKNEVCHVANYSLSRQDRKFTVILKNEPQNDFSDGTFIFEFDNNFDIKRMDFTNANKSLSRNYIVELNEDRNVSRYLYEKNGKINKTLVINYNSDPNAKYKVETIACYFEDDRISYYQKNTTTGKTRTRNKLTMKWNPWK